VEVKLRRCCTPVKRTALKEFMPLYFLQLDGHTFHQRMTPALAACWRERSFGPCRGLCAVLAPGAIAYAERYHTGPDEPLLCRIARDEAVPPLDAALWRYLAGEILLYGAADVPDVQTAPDTLCCLLAPDHFAQNGRPRDQFAPIQQAHRGTHDLYFGGGFYRPDQAGYNDADDVARLAQYLATINPDSWSPANLADLPDAPDEEARAEELAFARECLASLHDLYGRAARAGQVIVCEHL
jgi:hypothetical protein